MNWRFLLLFVVFFSVFALFAQKQAKKITFRAEWSHHDEKLLPGVDRLIGKVVFTHDQTIGYADSAHHYVDENKMIAYGKPVKIYVNDTVTLYGSRVVYDGNSKITTVLRNVILQDKTSTLKTDSLIYSTLTGIGYYTDGGKLITKEDTLTSRVGIYNTKTALAKIKDNVTLRNPTYVMKTDSFLYHTNTEVVDFLCRTHLVSDENNIYTDAGWFDTRQNISFLKDSVKIINENQILTSDSVFYDKNLGKGIGYQNTTIIDTTRGIIVKGNYAEYLENGGISWVTDSALLILIEKEQNDTLFLHGDTLKIYFDTAQNPQLMLAYNHVKFFSKLAQGACDSLAYNVLDSLGWMFYNPVVWNEQNQLTGDTIRFSNADSATMLLELLKDAFIVSDVFDEKEFNQVKGKTIIGFIRQRELQQINVQLNVEVIYYVMDDDTLLVGVNRMETNEMKIFLKQNQIQELRFYEYPDGKMWADAELPMNDRLLKDFRWLDKFRSKKIEDIFHTPIPREKNKKEILE